MKVLLEFNTHHYYRKYYKTEWYCPNCGKQEVWDESGEGDFYAGTTSYCTECGFQCNLLGGPSKITEKSYLNIVDQIRSGITLIPITKPGN